MKNYQGIRGLLALPVLLAGGLMLRAAEPADSPKINQLLAEAKQEAIELKDDSSEMDSFAKSNLSWGTFAAKVNMIREHVNNTGKLLAKMKAAEATGSKWQQSAIQRIEPLLKELAANTEATINHLNENSARIHFSEFKDYVKANYELASNLEALIHDQADYGAAKEKFERLAAKPGITE